MYKNWRKIRPPVGEIHLEDRVLGRSILLYIFVLNHGPLLISKMKLKTLYIVNGLDIFDVLFFIILPSCKVGYYHHHLQMRREFLRSSAICQGHTTTKWKRHSWGIGLIPKPLPFALPRRADSLSIGHRDGERKRSSENWTIQSNWSTVGIRERMKMNTQARLSRKVRCHIKKCVLYFTDTGCHRWCQRLVTFWLHMVKDREE